MGAQAAKKHTKPTSIADWKKKARSGKPVPLEVPSGNTCLVRPKGLDAFVSEGKVPNSLTKIVQDHIAENEGDSSKPFNVNDYKWDDAQLADAFSMVDAVVVECVIEPSILPRPESESERDPELLYVDEVDLDDRIFVFQFCIGGTRDLESFRGESAGLVDGSSAK